MGRKRKKEEHIQLSAPYAYVTAAESLTIARKWALERKDANAMIDIANSWTEIGHQLLTAEVELVYDEEEALSLSSEIEPPFAIGFTGGHRGKEEVEPSTEPKQD
jgi:hypothetical protein